MKRSIQLSLSLLLSVAFIAPAFGQAVTFFGKTYHVSKEVAQQAQGLLVELNSFPDVANGPKKILAGKIRDLLSNNHSYKNFAKEIANKAIGVANHYCIDAVKENKSIAAVGVAAGIFIGSGLAKKAVCKTGKLTKRACKAMWNNKKKTFYGAFTAFALGGVAYQSLDRCNLIDPVVDYVKPLATSVVSNITKDKVGAFITATALSTGITAAAKYGYNGFFQGEQKINKDQSR